MTGCCDCEVDTHALAARQRRILLVVLGINVATFVMMVAASVQSGSSALLAGRTTFVIAHRLSTIRRADLILLMEDGRIVERGTHESLMSRGGLYYDMVVRQMTSAGEEVLR